MCYSVVLLELLVQDRQAELRRLVVEVHRREPASESAGAALTRSGRDGREGMLGGLQRRLSFLTRSVVSGLVRLRAPAGKVRRVRTS